MWLQRKIATGNIRAQGAPRIRSGVHGGCSARRDCLPNSVGAHPERAGHQLAHAGFTLQLTCPTCCIPKPSNCRPREVACPAGLATSPPLRAIVGVPNWSCGGGGAVEGGTTVNKRREEEYVRKQTHFWSWLQPTPQPEPVVGSS